MKLTKKQLNQISRKKLFSNIYIDCLLDVDNSEETVGSIPTPNKNVFILCLGMFLEVVNCLDVEAHNQIIKHLQVVKNENKTTENNSETA